MISKPQEMGPASASSRRSHVLASWLRPVLERSSVAPRCRAATLFTSGNAWGRCAVQPLRAAAARPARSVCSTRRSSADPLADKYIPGSPTSGKWSAGRRPASPGREVGDQALTGRREVHVRDRQTLRLGSTCGTLEHRRREHSQLRLQGQAQHLDWNITYSWGIVPAPRKNYTATESNGQHRQVHKGTGRSPTVAAKGTSGTLQ